MKTNKYLGAYIYSVKKDGTLYKHADFIKFVGDEKTAADIVARLEKLNPGKRFVAAEEVDEDKVNTFVY